MANILDYVDWRGDLTLDQSPFNEVDNLILSQLSYLDFQGIVPPIGEGSCSLAEAAQALFARCPAGERPKLGLVVPDAVPVLLEKAAQAPRFRDMKLSGCEDHVDLERGEQFAALTVETGDRQIYCAFRGTDDTLAGWREDLELACVPEVPAQKRAVAYVKAAARQHPRRGIRLGGHSKGGNLAVYAGVFCPQGVQRRITAIWSNDGPGFYRDILDLPTHDRVEDRIHTIVPKSSVVGLLLEHEEICTIVDSDQLGLWQHDAFSWQVLGGRFVTLPRLSPQAKAGSLAIRSWLRGMTPEERRRFADGLFRVLTAAGAETLTDLKEDNLRGLLTMGRAVKDLDRETREGLTEFLQLLLRSNVRMVLEDLCRGAERKKGGSGGGYAGKEGQS